MARVWVGRGERGEWRRMEGGEELIEKFDWEAFVCLFVCLFVVTTRDGDFESNWSRMSLSPSFSSTIDF